MINIELILFIILFLIVGLYAVLIWTMQKRIESVAVKNAALAEKLKAGERVVIENFVIVEKRFRKIEHEIEKVDKRSEPKAKEALKAIRRLEHS